MSDDPRPDLSSVTLCAASSVAMRMTLEALQRSAQVCEFGAIKLFTDHHLPDLPSGIELVPIDRLETADAYTRFVLRDLHQHIDTTHALIVQWDGYVVDGLQWDRGFLSYDYVGAVWPQFADGHNVGNGGFSLRSKSLMSACATLSPGPKVPEDVQICRLWRERLEIDHDIRFAPAEVARRFSVEREATTRPTFGFHGIFNMTALLGEQRLLDTLDGIPAELIKRAEYRATLVDLLSRRRFRAARALVRKLRQGGWRLNDQVRFVLSVLKDLVQRRRHAAPWSRMTRT